MVNVARFVGRLKDSSVEFFVGVPVMLPYGCYCTDVGVCSITVSKGAD